MSERMTISNEQFDRLANRIDRIIEQVAELKGTVSAYNSGLEEERKAREALGRKLDEHDKMLRGDGTKNNPGLVEQIGDVRDLAQTNRDTLKNIRNAILGVGLAIAVPLVVDVVLRLLPLLYGPY